MTEKDASSVPAPKKGLFPQKKTEEPERDRELDGLMSEIESDIREDELKRIWTQYGSMLVVFAVLFVGGVGAFEAWRTYSQNQHEAAAVAYRAALNAAADEDFDGAQKQLEDVAARNEEPYTELARLTEAGVLLKKKDIEGALAAYAALASESGADPMLRDMATVLYVMHSLEREDAKKLEGELAPLRIDSVFKHSATELTALLAAKQGDLPRAAEIAQSLVDDSTVSQAMRQRAQDLAAMYKAGIVPVKLPPLDAPVDAPSVMAPVAPAAVPEPVPAKP